MIITPSSSSYYNDLIEQMYERLIKQIISNKIIEFYNLSLINLKIFNNNLFSSFLKIEKEILTEIKCI